MAALPTPWLRIDDEGHLVATNRALRALVGRDDELLLGRNLDALLTRQSRILHQSHLQPLLKLHGNIEEFSLSLEGSGGEAVDVLAYAQRHDGTRGPAGCTDFVLAPLRHRRRIEDELRRVKRAADHAPGMIFQLMRTADARWTFPYVSEVIRTLCGVTPHAARLSADAVFSRIEPEDLQVMAVGMKAAADAGKDWHGTYRFRQRDGSLRWHETHATPRQLDNGVTLWHGHAADVTERRAMEQSIADKEAADRLHRTRSEFLSRISHELRTPMSGILGFAQVLESDTSDPLTERQRDRVAVIHASATHLLNLINEVLDVTRIEANQLMLAVQPLRLRPQLEHARRIVESLAQAQGIQIEPIACDDTLAVMANEQRLQQVLVNLLSNAIKYNRAVGRVSLGAQATPGGIEIAVQDTGRGLTPQQQANLFQAFNRLGAEKTGTEGTGLGLVISRHLVTLMGGALSVRSELGQGTTFTIRLPAATAAEPPQPAPAADAALPAEHGPHTRGRVLFVEDNAVNVLLMKAIIAMRPGIELRVAGDGAGALAQALQAPPDLLLLDMHLPDCTGLDLLARLRRHAALQHIPAMVVSADALAEDIEAARVAGFDGYWTKPLDLQRTLAELDTWLRRPR